MVTYEVDERKCISSVFRFLTHLHRIVCCKGCGVRFEVLRIMLGRWYTLWVGHHIPGVILRWLLFMSALRVKWHSSGGEYDNDWNLWSCLLLTYHNHTSKHSNGRKITELKKLWAWPSLKLWLSDYKYLQILYLRSN